MAFSYTTFEYSDVSVSSNIYTDSLSVTVNVKNTGDTAGKDVVQLYIRKPYEEGAAEQSETILASFAKTELLEPGETQKVTLTINNYSMRSYSEENAEWYVGAGQYSAYVAPSVKDTGSELLRFRFRVENRITLQSVTNVCAPLETMKTYVRSGENAFVPQNQRINLALGTVASSDCSEIDAGPEYAVDGDFSTWWESDAGCDESHHWLCVDFGEPVRLSEVWIRWKSVARPYVIEARRSETDEWTELARYTAAFRKEERVLTDIEARYIQLRVEGGGKCAVYELGAYE